MVYIKSVVNRTEQEAQRTHALLTFSRLHVVIFSLSLKSDTMALAAPDKDVSSLTTLSVAEIM
jgi:hypothetical protein